MAAASYLICATPRSGSTLLCDLLKATGVAGRPASLYRRQSVDHYVERFGIAPGEGPDFERRYLEAAILYGTGNSGMFGMRLMWPSMLELQAKLRLLFPQQTTDTGRVAIAFGTPLYIHLQRQDRVAQAISRTKAEQSGLWHRGADGSERERVKPPEAANYDGAQLARFIAEATEEEAAWQRWFHAENIAPLELTYEALSADPTAVLATILEALGRNPAIAADVTPQTARLADADSAAWAARYRAEHPGG